MPRLAEVFADLPWPYPIRDSDITLACRWCYRRQALHQGTVEDDGDVTRYLCKECGQVLVVVRPDSGAGERSKTEIEAGREAWYPYTHGDWEIWPATILRIKVIGKDDEMAIIAYPLPERGRPEP